MMKKRFLITFISAAIFSHVVHAAEYKEISANGGEINWTKAQISAKGYGMAGEDANKRLAPILACRAAIVDAQRNLLETVQGTRISSTSTVNNFMLTSDEVKTTVDGVIKGGRVTDRQVDKNKVCEVTMTIDMNGSLASAIYQAESTMTAQAFNMPTFEWFGFNDVTFSFFNQAQADDIAPNWVESFDRRLKTIEERLLNGQLADTATNENTPTGLVIDARGSNFIPSLSPKVRELRGGVVYPEKKTKQSVIQQGNLVSLFATDVDFAIRHPKVGDRPLLVKALRTYGDTRTDIVLGKDASAQLREMIDSVSFADAGVIIVLD